MIRNNEIHHVLNETGDCGAIYGGRDWTACGTRITGNWIHDIGKMSGDQAHLGGRAIYLDDCLSGIRVDHNYVENAPLGILVGGGHYNLVEDNIVSHCTEGLQLDSRGITWMAHKLGELEKKLAATPVTQEPWASRYPELKDIMKHEPGKPVGTRIINNALVNCTKAWKEKSPSGVATVAPNWENSKVLIEKAGQITIPECPLTFAKPRVGARPAARLSPPST
jgi:Right handed beta helix region